MVTYGDGVSDVNIRQLVQFHKTHGKAMTLTGIQPEGRFGVMELSGDDRIRAFREKDRDDAGWVNGGFMVCGPEVLDCLDGDDVILEQEPMKRLAAEGQLMCYRHHGFWQCMDTLRDREKLEKLWAENNAPWKVWN